MKTNKKELGKEQNTKIESEKTENNTINLTTNERTQQEITISGNPGKPVGEDGEKMLRRMNESHYVVTGLALENWKIR